MAVERRDSVQLGCGTLILIALIVIIFSNRDTSELEDRIDDLTRQITRLEETVGDLSEAVRAGAGATPAVVEEPVASAPGGNVD